MGGVRQDTGPLLGSIDQALVGIEVVNTARDGATRQARHGNGLLLRSDGFVLAPADLFSYSMRVAGQSETAGQQAVTVITNPGTPKEKRAPGRRPRFFPKDAPYAVLKLDDFNAPALLTLLPDALKPEDPVQVVWSVWDLASGHFSRPQRQEARLTPTSEVDRKSASVQFIQPIPKAEWGAAVVGPHGYAIGMVTTSTGPVARMASMSALDRTTNCVTPLPTAEPLTPPEEAGVRFSPMVEVSGGRLFLPLAVQTEQPDMEGGALASVAPFQIDEFEVTNEEYLAYWLSLPKADKKRLGFRSNYYPWTWAEYPTEPPFPSELARCPVLGVPLPGAIGYAHWRGKRLPTPYEWCMAAFGPRGDAVPSTWAANYIHDRQSAWEKVTALHSEFLREHRELQQQGTFYGGWNRLPWIAQNRGMLEVSQWSLQAINSVFDEVWNMWREPFYVRPVGTREYDVSPCGAMDMGLNASELVMPTPGLPAMGNARYMEMQWIPAKPKQDQPWLPQQIRAVYDSRGLPALSRLFRREMIGPTNEELLLWSNLSETTQFMWPIVGWRLAMTGDAQETAAMTLRGQNPYGPFNRPAGFQVWTAMPHHFRREMALDIPVDRAEVTAIPGPQLMYFLPVGFRCAR